MAQRTQILLIDDIDGGEAHESLTFGLDGKVYEIDLSDENAAELRRILEPYVKAGRKTSRPGTRGRVPAPRNTGGADTSAIRAWAKEHGYEVNDRGRVPANIREAYEKANG